jgi:hypothetical protein
MATCAGTAWPSGDQTLPSSCMCKPTQGLSYKQAPEGVSTVHHSRMQCHLHASGRVCITCNASLYSICMKVQAAGQPTLGMLSASAHLSSRTSGCAVLAFPSTLLRCVLRIAWRQLSCRELPELIQLTAVETLDAGQRARASSALQGRPCGGPAAQRNSPRGAHPIPRAPFTIALVCHQADFGGSARRPSGTSLSKPSRSRPSCQRRCESASAAVSGSPHCAWRMQGLSSFLSCMHLLPSKHQPEKCGAAKSNVPDQAPLQNRAG